MTGAARRAGGPDVVCVLAEGSYFHGVAALINSLLRNGFTGTVLVGHRGPAPAWTAGPLPPGLDLRLLPVPAGWHLTNLKPHLLREALTRHCPEAERAWYFDADVVVMGPWAHFPRWAAGGVLAALDVADTFMPPCHAFRDAWRALAAEAGFACREVTGYANAGFLGVPRPHLAFLDVWQALLRQREARGADLSRLRDEAEWPEFSRADQDVLNAALMASEAPYRFLGVEALGRFPFTHILGHTMIFEKPWRRRHIRDALKGFQPDHAERAFWRYAEGPIRSFTPWEWRRKRLERRIARVIGLFLRRSLMEW
ncbi:MAG: glycosyltransferase [Roseococcus sp.]|nr:glycosyltransferase [Roseococcus sp.]